MSKKNIYKKGYNHNEWINLCDAIINFLIVFGSIINLIIFAFLGFNIACYTAFFSYLIMGISKLAIVIIRYFRQ